MASQEICALGRSVGIDVERSLGESKHRMNLFLAGRWRPPQELIDCRALIDVLEKCGNGQTRALEAPCPSQLAWVPFKFQDALKDLVLTLSA